MHQELWQVKSKKEPSFGELKLLQREHFCTPRNEKSPEIDGGGADAMCRVLCASDMLKDKNLNFVENHRHLPHAPLPSYP